MTTRDRFLLRFAAWLAALTLVVMASALLAFVAWLWSFDTGKIVIFAVVALVALWLAHRSWR